jgi:hypothetical protein
MLKRLLLASVLLAPVGVQAEVIVGHTESATVQPGSAIQWHTSRNYKFLELGDVDTVEARAGATDRDVIVIAKPLKDGKLSGSASVLALDEDGKLVGILRVTITRSGRPLNIVKIVHGTVPSYHDCDSNSCADVDISNKPLPDAVTTTHRMNDGGIITRQYGPAIVPVQK